jgi:hypothetical protein
MTGFRPLKALMIIASALGDSAILIIDISALKNNS